MNHRKNRDAYLLDTSIQIKRLLYRDWKKNSVDNIWNKINPKLSTYSYMEFKNAIIASFKYLIDVIEEIKNKISYDQDNGLLKPKLDTVTIRLSDIIKEILKGYHSERKYKIMMLIAHELIVEYEKYPRLLSPDEVIEKLSDMAEDLENHWFFWFPNNGSIPKDEMVNTTECYLAERFSPLKNGEKYTCKKGQFACNILDYCQSNEVNDVFDNIKLNNVRIKDKRMKKGIFTITEKMQKGTLVPERSVGKRLCWCLGDVLIFSKTLQFDFGLFSADFDHKILSDYYKKHFLFLNSEYEIKKGE